MTLGGGEDVRVCPRELPRPRMSTLKFELRILSIYKVLLSLREKSSLPCATETIVDLNGDCGLGSSGYSFEADV